MLLDMRALLLALALSAPLAAQSTQGADWRYWGGDAHGTRYSPHAQITGENFTRLETAWVWRADNYSPEPDALLRATPIYAAGKLC